MPRWDEDARAKQRQLINELKIWVHSTGAKTEEGKKKCSQNAIKKPRKKKKEKLPPSWETIEGFSYQNGVGKKEFIRKENGTIVEHTIEYF